MTFENVIEPADFGYFRRQLMIRATGWRRMIPIFVIFFVPPVLQWGGGFDFLTVVVTVLVTIYLLVGSQFLIQSRLNPRADGIIFETKTLNVDSTGVRQSSKRTDLFYSWDAIQSAQVTDRMLILYLEPALGIPIPRRNLHPESFHELIKTLRHFAPQLEKDLADQ